MPKSAIRLAVFILIPCLVLDPAIASTYSQTSVLHLSVPERLSAEALAPIANFMHIAASPITWILERQLGTMAEPARFSTPLVLPSTYKSGETYYQQNPEELAKAQIKLRELGQEVTLKRAI